MKQQPTVVSHLYVKVNGNEVADELLGRMTEVLVDQHAGLPGMFTIRFYDADLSLLDTGPFNLATPIEILSRLTSGEPISLIKGEITALEPHFGEGMVAELVVRGYDIAHRLYREVKSKTYLNVKDSDLAIQFANACRLETDQIETTKTVYDHLYQHNQSDLQFLMQRAWRIGYECFIDGKKFIFRSPQNKQAKNKLAWGEDLLSFSPRMTLAEQVEKVLVKGWDIQKKAAITGQAEQGRLYPQIEEVVGKQDGKSWSKKLSNGSKHVFVNLPIASQAEADIVAAARLDEISGVFVEAEGTAFRRPDIRAGQTIKLEGLGKRFSGSYLVTSATHLYTHEGFKTNFSVRGTRAGLLLEQMAHRSLMDRWPGVVPAIVTNSDDPNGWGRVKVKFPWLSDSEESDWARVIGIGGGNAAGFCAVPAVEDEVLVTFVHGDFGSPVVLGGLWNGQDALPSQVANAPEGEKSKVRTWHTPKGHRITLYDNSENKIEVVTQGGLSIKLDDNGAEITIDSSANITVKAGASLTLQASNVSIKADANLELNSNGPVAIKGAIVALN